MSDDGFNGWDNRETWLVSMHIDNDMGLYDQTLRMAERVNDRFPRRDNLDDLSNRSAEHELTERLESLVRDIVERENIDSIMVSDLVGGTINSVNFREIAESKLFEIKEGETINS